jgi:hypothetical protein
MGGGRGTFLAHELAEWTQREGKGKESWRLVTKAGGQIIPGLSSQFRGEISN